MLSVRAFFLFFLFSQSIAFADWTLIDRIEASVNGAIIFRSDLDRWKTQVPLRSQLDPLFANSDISQKGAQASPEEVSQFLVNEKLISIAFPVADAEVDQKINSIQVMNKISRARLKSALEEQGFKFEDYFELIRSSASKETLIDREIRSKVTISEDDLKNFYYNEQKRDSGFTLQYHLKLIRISSEQYKSVEVTQQQAKLALESLKAGTPFEEVAKRYSDDDSASSGGDLGVMSEDQISKALLPHVKKMKIGEVSPLIPFNSGQAFLILKLTDLVSSDQDQYQKAKEEIRARLYTAEYKHQIQLWLERQREKSFIHIPSQKP